MMQVISASRRTDIPAFYSEWFVNRLRDRLVFVQNPYSKKITRISLESKDVAAIVFWSKNYAPLLNRLEDIEKTTCNLFFHFTITGNRDLESNAPDYRDAIQDYLFLAKKYSSEQIVWRFDPLCITDKLSYDTHEERFVQCADALKGYAKKCIISFVHPYKKVLLNFKRYTDHHIAQLSEDEKRQYANRLAKRAEKHGIRLYACCNDYLLSESIGKAGCINGNSLSEIFNTDITTQKGAPRKGCGCTRSIDIGAYDTCSHGCLYCYANTDRERAARFRHDSGWNALHCNVDESESEAGSEKDQLALAY